MVLTGLNWTDTGSKLVRRGGIEGEQPLSYQGNDFYVNTKLYDVLPSSDAPLFI